MAKSRKTRAVKPIKSDHQPTRSATSQQLNLKTFVLAGLIIVAGIAAYSNSISGAFVLDDRRNIQDSSTIRILLPTRESLLGPPWTTFTGRPVAMFTLALDYKMGGLQVEGYHIFNIVVHLLAGLTLWGILRRTFRTPKLQFHFRGMEDFLATTIALLWVVHPLTTSSVTYISQRAESLMGLFYLQTLYCFIRGVSGRKSCYVAVVVCFVLGLGTKEPMVSAPIIVLLYDRTLITGSFSQAFKQRRWLYLALAAAWIPFAFFLSLHPHGPDVGLNFDELSAIDYLKTQSGVIAHYLRLCFWPSPLILYYGGANYDVPILRTFSQYAPWGAIIVLLLALSFWAIWKNNPGGILGAWFFLILAPSSSIISMPSEVIAEYRMYLPLIAVILGVVTGIYLLLARFSQQATVAQRRLLAVSASFMVLIATLAFVVLCRARNDDFQTPYALWADEVRHLPNNSAAAGNLGILEYEAGRFNDAERHLRQALASNPKAGPPRAALGKLYEKSGRLDDAIAQYRLGCENAPRLPDSFVYLAAVLASQGKTDEAIGILRTAVAQVPWSRELQTCLGVLLTISGKQAEANTCLEQAVRMNADPAQAQTQIGAMLGQLGATKAGIEHLRQAAALSSTDPTTYSELGDLLGAQGLGAEAAKQYRYALKLSPNDPAILNNLAWILATSNDASARNALDAIKYAEQAARLSSRQNPMILDTLAAAYAEAGQFDLAVNALQEALHLAGNAPNNSAVADMRSRLELYKQGQPFREKPAASSEPASLSGNREAVHKAEQNPGDANADEIRQRLVLYRSGHPFRDQTISSTQPGIPSPTNPNG